MQPNRAQTWRPVRTAMNPRLRIRFVIREHDVPNGTRSHCQRRRCELDQLPKSSNRAAESPFQQLMFGLLRPPQLEVGFHPRLHFFELEGLGDVVDPSRSKSLYLVFECVQALRKITGMPESCSLDFSCSHTS